MEPFPRSAGPPGLAQQKAFILANSLNLNRETMLMILSLVLFGTEEAGGAEEAGARAGAEVCTASPLGTNVDLDALREDVVGQIYNVVHARVQALRSPAP